MLTELGITKPLGLPIEEIEEFRLVINLPSGESPPGAENRPWIVLMCRAQRPFAWKELAMATVGEAEDFEANGQEYFRAKQRRSELSAYWHPDNRTIVLTGQAQIERTFTLRGLEDERGWRAKWRRVADAPAAVMLKPQLAQPLVPRHDIAQEPHYLADDAELLLLKGTEVNGQFQVAGTLDCTTAEGAKRIETTVRRVLGSFQLELGKMRTNPNAQLGPEAGLADALGKLINDTQLKVDGTTLTSLTTVDKNLGQILKAAIVPARVAARRSLSTNRLKHIMLAMHNYHDVNKFFPPATVMGPDGKTPHSSRVALLPYLEGEDSQALYDRYKFDEPWDSENNKAIIKDGAKYFGVTDEDGSVEDCSYFAIVGAGTVFDPAAGPIAIRGIIDGTSKTVGIVEAKRKIPWTKPEDIEYDADKPIPKLGGFFEGGFNSAYMDGSVHYLPLTLDEATLRALITRSGREAIGNDPQTGLPQVQQ